MVLNNIKIVTPDGIIENGYISIKDGIIVDINKGNYSGNDQIIDGKGQTAMPGFIDIHMHGSCGIDFMDAKPEDYKTIANALYKEGVTTFLATTLTSDKESLLKVCRAVKEAKESVPSLGGIHLEGPYISVKYKGAQNEEFIRNPNVKEMAELIEASGNNVRYISMAPEKDGSLEFIKFCVENGVTVSAGHTDATFRQVKEAMKYGLTNTTHTYNAMSGHTHRNPGVVSAALYYDKIFTEFICDGIHVCNDTLKISYKIIGPERFIVITDALKIKNSDLEKFELFGLPCIRKDGAAYLEAGPLAGSLLTMDQGVRNMYEVTKANLVDLSKICSRNAANSLHFYDRGELKVGKIADIVLLNGSLQVQEVYKLGNKVL